jgi:hypothetical protein
MRSRSLWIVRNFAFVVAVVFVAAFLVYSCAFITTQSPIPADEQEARCRAAAALPIGSSRKQVESWLASEGFSFGQLIEPDGNLITVGSFKQYANWHGETGRLEMYFEFNSDGKLHSCTVHIARIPVFGRLLGPPYQPLGEEQSAMLQ